jgi:hypothetical protein
LPAHEYGEDGDPAASDDEVGGTQSISRPKISGNQEQGKASTHVTTIPNHQTSPFLTMSSPSQYVSQKITGRYITHAVLREYLTEQYADRYTIRVSKITAFEYGASMPY